MNDVQIVGWQDDYQQDYYNLAAEWLERYLSIEPGDLALMEHPREAVIARDGDIFFARLGGKNVGTISLVPHAPAVYEVAKFAVTPACQGQHVGSLLLEHLLARARAREAEKLVLYTSHILQPAIHLYEKYGFYRTPANDSPFADADIRMELSIYEKEE